MPAIIEGECLEEDLIIHLSIYLYTGGGGGSSGGDAWNMGGLEQNLPDSNKSKTPESFLGANANLVNLDQLVAKAPPKGGLMFVLLIYPLRW